MEILIHIILHHHISSLKFLIYKDLPTNFFVQLLNLEIDINVSSFPNNIALTSKQLGKKKQKLGFVDRIKLNAKCLIKIRKKKKSDWKDPKFVVFSFLRAKEECWLDITVFFLHHYNHPKLMETQ